MKKSLTQAVAVSAVCAAALAGSIGATAGSTATAVGAQAKPKGITEFGFRANVFGTKAVVDGVELKTLKDALVQQKCTRQLRGELVKGSALSTSNILPGLDELIRISPSTSRTQTYRSGSTYGVRGTNVIGDISVGGGELPGVGELPHLTIKALVSSADSFYNGSAKRFGHRESFTFGGIGLDLGDSVITAPIQDLLDAIGVQDILDTVVNETVNAVIQALVKNLGTIEIPGLGSISLGRSTGATFANGATSEAYALKIQVNNPLNDRKTVVQLGRAVSSIQRGVPSGVFRSTMSALELNVGNLLTFGSVNQTTLPCAGTGGRTRVKRVASAGVIGLVDLKNVAYSYRGRQVKGTGKRKGRNAASGFVQTSIGRATVPAAGIVVNNLVSRVDMRSGRENKLVKRKVTTRYGSIQVKGKTIPALKPGQTYSFPGGSIRYRVVQNDNFYGTEVRGLRITLFNENVVINLGQAAGRIFFK
ncbi:hypothetical protein [Nocardioides sp. SYSU D00038]|uniref:hypothetical protein n=1 Tax=Nocardioides sp. SYSU D00038 TaxID=2812554 RepID=UPI0019675EE9|nr:hypothetical protein [Nocardioides sp. SYSU D00038]